MPEEMQLEAKLQRNPYSGRIEIAITDAEGYMIDSVDVTDDAADLVVSYLFEVNGMKEDGDEIVLKRTSENAPLAGTGKLVRD